jgi:type I restriction enzyme S subunit
MYKEKHILLSIQPRIVEEIISGEKKFEFRRKFSDLTKPEISNTVIIYCSSPVMKIIGSFVVKKFYHSDFDTLMKQVKANKEYEQRIANYLIDKTSCFAMEISELKLYEYPLSLGYLRNTYLGFVPGQSYRYLPGGIKNELISRNQSL